MQYFKTFRLENFGFIFQDSDFLAEDQMLGMSGDQHAEKIS
jgi:hypothetical protein